MRFDRNIWQRAVMFNSKSSNPLLQQNSRELTANLNFAKSEAHKVIGPLERELKRARRLRLSEQDQADLEWKLDQARGVYDRLLVSIETQIRAGIAVLEKSLQQVVDERAANASKLKERLG
jgi:hypothetical protein